MNNLNYFKNLINLGNKFYPKEIFISEKDLKIALSFVNKALSLSFDPPETLLFEAYLLRGKINFSLQNYEESILDFNRILEIQKDNIMAYFYRGKAKKELMLFDESLIDFDMAIKLNPNDQDFLIERAYLKSFLNKLPEALDDLDAAININPNNTFNFIQKGNIEFQIGNYGESLKNFDIALKKMSDNDLDRYLLENVHRKFAEEKYIENLENLLNSHKLI